MDCIKCTRVKMFKGFVIALRIMLIHLKILVELISTGVYAMVKVTDASRCWSWGKTEANLMELGGMRNTRRLLSR